MPVLSSGNSFLQGNPFCTSSFRFRWKKTGQDICIMQNENNVYKQSDIWESNNKYQMYSLLGHDTVQFGRQYQIFRQLLPPHRSNRTVTSGRETELWEQEMRLGRGQLRSEVPPKWWYTHNIPGDHNLSGILLIYFKNIYMELKFQPDNEHVFT